jgi:polyhydroxyalkanoate synthesis regulator phasin
MYATEKYVRMEAKELQQTIHELANDLGGDIRYLHQELTELRNQVQQLTENITELREHLNV